MESISELWDLFPPLLPVESHKEITGTRLHVQVKDRGSVFDLIVILPWQIALPNGGEPCPAKS